MLDHSDLVGRMMEANSAHAEGLDRADPGPRPRLGLAIVTCMDCRLDVYDMLGLEAGDAHVIRNAGGIVTDDVIRSLCLSQRTLGTTHVLVIHHTRCGLEGLSDNDFLASLIEETGERPEWVPGGFGEVSEDLRASVTKLMQSPFVEAGGSVSGFVYDVETGLLAPMPGTIDHVL